MILRDARPFTADPGAHAFSLPWPLPRTITGALRTHIGNTATQWIDWDLPKAARRARSVASHGPLMVSQHVPGGAWEVCVPAPRDLVFYRTTEDDPKIRAMVLRPENLGSGEGCDVPTSLVPGDDDSVRNLANTELRPMSIYDDVKPDSTVPAWWKISDAVAWLKST